MHLISFLSIFWFIIGACLYRIRGGWDPVPIEGTQTARALWCIGFGTFAWATLQPDLWLLPATISGAFLALLLPHARGQDYGTTDGTRLGDVLFMSIVGILRMAIFLAPMALDRPQLMVLSLAGALQGPCYAIGWQMPVPRSWLNNNKRPVDAPTANAELLWGGCQFLAIYLGSLCPYVMEVSNG
jgi:hypothetical protein